MQEHGQTHCLKTTQLAFGKKLAQIYPNIYYNERFLLALYTSGKVNIVFAEMINPNILSTAI